jgi:2-dehydropantoate 2-reductase
MRVLVVGAGATGGYFGGRLAQLGRDVTFLVRTKRAAHLATSGLTIKSAHGDFSLPKPQTVLAEQIDAPFDLILLSCKAYDLDGAIDSFAPAVGADTAILPLLNGMRHMDALNARFGKPSVLGGQCVIAATLDEKGNVIHLNNVHGLSFGEQAGVTSARVKAIADLMSGVGFDWRLSEDIVQDMWEKWVFLATLASTTCLMRASIGDMLKAPNGKALVLGVFEQCRDIATKNSHAPRASAVDQARKALTQEGSSLTASMLRDIERGAAIEADHIIGDLLTRAATHVQGDGDPSLLQVAYAHLKAYEARRAGLSAVAAA